MRHNVYRVGFGVLRVSCGAAKFQLSTVVHLMASFPLVDPFHYKPELFSKYRLA